MPIKLLKKSEIAQKKAADTRAEIDQGKQLAQRVDNLRQIAADEEKSLRDFRENTIRRLNEEIQEAVTKRDGLLSEVSDLRAEKEEGLKRVQAKEREVKHEYYLAKAARAEAEGVLYAVSSKEKTLKEKMEKVEKRITTLDKSIKKQEWLTSRANELVQENNATLRRTRIEAESLNKTKIQVGEELLQRELAVAARERDVQLKLDHVRFLLKELEEKERAVNDKYATLLKTEKRVNPTE